MDTKGKGFTGTGRRGWAPRSGFARGEGRGGRYADPGKRDNMPRPDLSQHPLGELMTTITMSDLLAEEKKTTAKITDCQYVASYNWLSKAMPTILIPGQ